MTIFVYNLVNKHFARGFYQVLCIIFGNILVLYLCLYFILNLQITSDYINQVLVYNFTQLAVEKNDFLLTLAYQSFAVIGSGLLIGALTTSNHLLGDAKDKSIKWVLLLSFIFTVVYSLFSQSFGLYSILNIVPYGLVLTALSLDDAIKREQSELLTDVVMVTRFTHLKFLVSSLVVITSYLLQSLHLLSQCQSLCSYLI